MRENFENMSASEIARLVNAGEISAVEVCTEFLARAADDGHNAYITLANKIALESAERVDKLIREGENLPLAGVPVSVKDNICTDGIRTTCASRFLRDFTPSYSATAYIKMISAGAVPVGKANMDEFAVGGEGDTSYFGKAINPLDPSRSAGGSSSGSAVSVASGIAAASLGSDTGGSARVPAAFCGVYGMKPTYGAVSRFGLVGMAPSFEQICPITKTLDDSELLLDVIKGKDRRDMTSKEVAFREINNDNVLRIGVFLPDGCDADVVSAVTLATRKLTDFGAVADAVTLPEDDSAVRVYYTLSSAETYSNLARFDGMRYGFTSDSGSVFDSRAEGFGKTLRERIAEGVYVLEHNGGEAYIKALELRRSVREGMTALFDKYDVVVTPVCRTATPLAGDVGYTCDLFTVYANLCGCPALVIPFGLDGAGLPVGIQLMASHGSEKLLYKTADMIEGRDSL